MDPIAQVRERLSAIATEILSINETAAAEQRLSLTADETSNYEALSAERTQLEAREAQLVAEAERRQKGIDGARKFGAAAGVTVGAEPRTYDPAARHSYFLDMARVQLGRGDGDGGVDAARDRLARHTQELRTELPAREARRDAAAKERSSHSLGVHGRDRDNMFEKRTNPNRTDGQGGYFVPPLWLVDQYIDLPRYGRTTANLVSGFGLPSGTDSINIPKVNSGTATGVQTADAGSVTSTDLTDTYVTAPVRTIAGQQDIALQLLDQSPVSFDEIVFADLIADYNQRVDVQVISGTGSNGQVTGILNVSGINSVTYTDASPTLPELWVPLLQSASKIATGRKMAATGVILTPSLWYWAMSQLDTTNRPLIVPTSNQYNAAAIAGGLDADGPAGVFTYGLPAFLDGNVPSNLGAGTNETRVITARFSDLYLWEGSLRTRVLSEVLSGTLQVRLQVYNYVAFMGNRRPESVSVISGTGVIPATGF